MGLDIEFEDSEDNRELDRRAAKERQMEQEIWQQALKADSFNVQATSKKAKDAILKYGPQDLKLPVNNEEDDQIYYNLYGSSSSLRQTPYAGLENVLYIDDPNDFPEKLTRDLKEAIRKINKIECENKKCELVKNKIAHFHCNDCGQPYELRFDNYHDIVNREDHCKRCYAPLDYGEGFNEAWKDVEQDVSDVLDEQDEAYEEEMNSETANKAKYDENEQEQEDADYSINGEWKNGFFHDYMTGNVVRQNKLHPDSSPSSTMHRVKPIGHYEDDDFSL